MPAWDSTDSNGLVTGASTGASMKCECGGFKLTAHTSAILLLQLSLDFADGAATGVPAVAPAMTESSVPEALASQEWTSPVNLAFVFAFDPQISAAGDPSSKTVEAAVVADGLIRPTCEKVL